MGKKKRKKGKKEKENKKKKKEKRGGGKKMEKIKRKKEKEKEERREKKKGKRKNFLKRGKMGGRGGEGKRKKRKRKIEKGGKKELKACCWAQGCRRCSAPPPPKPHCWLTHLCTAIIPTGWAPSSAKQWAKAVCFCLQSMLLSSSTSSCRDGEQAALSGRVAGIGDPDCSQHTAVKPPGGHRGR